MISRLTFDEDARRVLITALDLYMRVGMGQWGEVAAHSQGVLPTEQLVPHSPAAQALARLRCEYAVSTELRSWPSAYLGIGQAHGDARIGCDLYRALGGGMTGRRADRLTGVTAVVEPDPWAEAR